MAIERPVRRMVVMTLLGAAMCSTPAEAQKGGKGGGGGATLPNARYTLSQIPLPSHLRGMNSSGMVVGDDYDSTGQLRPYVRMVDGTVYAEVSLDLLASHCGWPLPDGFRFRSAYDVNESGLVVGSMGTDDLLLRQGYVLDTGLSTDPGDWVFYALPTLGAPTSAAYLVNDWGDVVVRYDHPDGGSDWYLYNYYAPATNEPLALELPGSHAYGLNNLRQVLLKAPGSYSPALFEEGRGVTVFSDADYYPPSGPSLLNDAGVFAWQAVVQTRGRNTARVPVRRNIGGSTLEYLMSTSSAPYDINQQSDVTIHYGGSPSYLYHNEAGLLPIADLIPDSDPLKSFWVGYDGRAQLLTDRSSDPTRPDALLPVILGTVETADGGIHGIMMTPVFATQ